MYLNQLVRGHLLHHRPAEVSGGQQQRAAIARPPVSRSTIILADGPTANLDWQGGTETTESSQGVRAEDGESLVTATNDHKMLETVVHNRDDAVAITQARGGSVSRGAPSTWAAGLSNHHGRR